MQQTSTQSEKKTRPAPVKVIVRYGALGFVGEFNYFGDEVFWPGRAVLVETDRGLELGWFVCYLTAVENGFVLDRDAVDNYVKNSGLEYLRPRVGQLVRPADQQDLREQEHIRADADITKQYCEEAANRLGLKMKIISVEHLFGGERIIFYFMAETRVDFRELVRNLAREYQTRIELRQIGARDEARLLADYEICGRQCCCKNFLKILRPVNMKMAKLQKATLDPSKVSGRCGRLRCCLAYEHQAYEDLADRLPNIGCWVQTAYGIGRVKDRQMLTQLVQVAFEGDRMIAIPAEELTPSEPPGLDAQIETDSTAAESPLAQASADDDEVTDLTPSEETGRTDTDQTGRKKRRKRRGKGKTRRKRR